MEKIIRDKWHGLYMNLGNLDWLRTSSILINDASLVSNPAYLSELSERFSTKIPMVGFPRLHIL